ncbi:MAG: Ig-like domain repeat protein [Methanobrevibacter sp.]|uniref:Ig-like domain repeat protein n=1 Tax=Methanobrevibacter sp. TaxID=66852 RepID=UPI0026DF76D4|nr:Ig-like domain repeat protein [Methanobrevibacter sp.]MDO5849090.1 Ig-like domain repeat protein [Methanobrevibacter sp.]
MKLYRLIIIGLLVCLCFSSVVSADVNVNGTEGEWGNPSVDINITGNGSSNPVNPPKSTHDLQVAIDNTEDGGILYLNNSYYSVNSTILISKAITIIGHEEGGSGYATVDGGNKTNLFIINNEITVTFENVNLINAKPPRDNTEGAAIYSSNTKSVLVVTNCSFVNDHVSHGNSVGGAISTNGKLIPSYCTFINCSSWQGGAIDINSASHYMTFTNCTFIGCYAYNAGGAIAGKWYALVNCTFINNTADHLYGGAIYASTVRGLNNCTFINNHANSYGGAIYTNDIYYTNYNSVFINNSGYNGGAIYGYYAKIDGLVNFTFINNTAINGGAFYLRNTNYVLNENFNNCTFINNTATNSGGAIGVDTSSSVTFKFYNATFVGNTAGVNGGALNLPGNVYATIDNSVFYNNTAESGSNIYGTSKVTADGNWWGNNTVNGVEGFDVSNWLILELSEDKDRFTLSFKVKDENGETEYAEELPVRDYSFSTNFGSFDPAEGSIQNAATSTLTTDMGGEYHIVGTVDGQSLSLTIDVPVVDLTSNSPVNHGEDIVLSATVAVNGNPVSGQVEFYDGNGNLIDTTNLDADGKASTALENYAAGKYSNYYAKFTGNDDYLSSRSDKVNFTINKAVSECTISIDNITYGNQLEVKVTATVNGEGYTGEVEVAIGGENFVVDVTGGTGSLVISEIFDADNYTATVELAGDENLTGSEATVEFSVYKATSSVSIDVLDITFGENVKGTVEVSDNLNGEAIVEINGKKFTVTITNGEGAFDLDINLAAGQYGANVNFTGDKNHLDSADDTTFEVEKATPDCEISVNNITYGDSIVVDVKVLVNGEGYTGQVTVTVNGKTFVVDIEDGRGFTTISEIFDADNYTATVKFTGNQNLTDSEASTEFTINKASSQVHISLVDMKYGENLTGEVNVDENLEGSVVLKIEGKEYNVDVSNGHGVVNINTNLPKGQYAVNAMYLGDLNHNSSTTAEIFNIDHADSKTVLTLDNILMEIKLKELSK